jgi:hypothetical protein
MNDEVADGFNLDGKKGKMSLKSTPLFQLISDTISTSKYSRGYLADVVSKAVDKAQNRKFTKIIVLSFEVVVF